jgi:hypothetical protein
MSDVVIGANLLDRLHDLEQRLAALERSGGSGLSGTDQTIKGSHDRLDAGYGAGNAGPPTTPTANLLLALNASAQLPAHTVGGVLNTTGGTTQTVTTLIKRTLGVGGAKALPASGTAVDLMTFTCAGGVNNSVYNGVLVGTLHINIAVRTTAGATNEAASVCTLNCASRRNNTMDLAATVGTLYNVTAGTITLALGVKAGASASSVTLTATVTCTNLDTANSYIFLDCDLLSSALYAENFITPAFV